MKKLWSSVRGQAEKVAFEADKMMRVRKEESAIHEARNQIQAKQLELGKVALALFQAGELDNPQVATIAADIAGIEAEIKKHEEKIALIKAEQFEAERSAESTAPEQPDSEA